MSVYDTLRSLSDKETKRARLRNERQAALKELNEVKVTVKETSDRAVRDEKQAHDLQVVVEREEKAVSEQRAAMLKRRESLSAISDYKVQQNAEAELEKHAAEVALKEDAILVKMEEAEAVFGLAARSRAAADEAQEVWKRLSSDISEAMERFDERELRLEQERSQLLGELADYQASAYERACEKYPAQPVAVLQKDICGVCFMKIRPQTVVNVTKAEQLQKCNGCARILILPAATG
jgi:uncharacterized protein